VIDFFVPGDPAPQGSKNAYARGGRVILVEASKRTGPWRSAVTAAARSAREAIDGPTAVTLDFVLARPRTSTRPHPTTKPDVDKLARAVLDGITDARMWKDDSQVCHLTATKSYGPLPGVRVRLACHPAAPPVTT
jgi:crossover junction endodeoxyribonuclease RusA